jgi:hypothetical protein
MCLIVGMVRLLATIISSTPTMPIRTDHMFWKHASSQVELAPQAHGENPLMSSRLILFPWFNRSLIATFGRSTSKWLGKLAQAHDSSFCLDLVPFTTRLRLVDPSLGYRRYSELVGQHTEACA